MRNGMHIELHWYHWVLAALALVGLLLPLVFWKGRRVGYVAALSGLTLVTLVVFWVIDRKIDGRFEITNSWSKGTTQAGADQGFRHAFLEWCDGEVSIGWDNDRWHVPAASWNEGALEEGIAHGGWNRTLPRDIKGGPSKFGQTPLRLGGFRLTLRRARYDPTIMQQQHVFFAEFVAPMWFVALALLVFPAFWLYRSRWGAAKQRLRKGLCVNCGYSRRGIDAASRCPE